MSKLFFSSGGCEVPNLELAKESKSELLKTVAGTEEELSGGGKSRSVWAQFSDGGDTTDRRRHNWEDVGERGQSLWVQSSDGGDARGMSPGQEG
ncbi:unnamed protein product [Prunus armeniaca]|uniref:Uncharacterized protein n=1 Tax=Prunus armeniaca TaxID=36596 RepID=A0A6J5XRI4_PRUAR|nr:unnamed protein product [Prunus armeniaca]